MSWLRMPAYARDGNVVCSFQSAQKVKTRYVTLGFSDTANLDKGYRSPTAFAPKELTAVESRLEAAVDGHQRTGMRQGGGDRRPYA